jgi:signal transduction histidine kinase
MPHVFEPFRQAESITIRKGGGLGLALAITRHLIAQHGGTVAVASDGEGRGSTFTVRLPLTLFGQLAGDGKAATDTKDGDQPTTKRDDATRGSDGRRL